MNTERLYFEMTAANVRKASACDLDEDVVPASVVNEVERMLYDLYEGAAKDHRKLKELEVKRRPFFQIVFRSKL